MQRQVWLVDAFTTKVFTGNPAGVVPDARGLTDHEMQSIAGELHASETAFIVPSNGDADIRIRYFTPTSEVDLCGHATIASICSLAEQGEWQLAEANVCRIDTNVGVLRVGFEQAGDYFFAEMEQVAAEFRQLDTPPAETARLLGIDESMLDLNLPYGLAYTGLWDAFVPVRNIEIMRQLKPIDGPLADWNRRLGVTSTHVYCRETLDSANDYHARDFSPAVGIPEDPATGTASGALAALLHHHGLLSTGQAVRFEQGFEIGRDSIITAKIVEKLDKLTPIVGGHAVRSVTGLLAL